LKGDFDYLLTIESDVMPPADIVEELLLQDCDVVCAIYFIGKGDGNRLINFELDDSFGMNVNRNIFLGEGFHQYGTGKTKSCNCGLGCCLIKREVVEEIPFRVEGCGVHNDSFFGVDCFQNGIELKVIDLIVEHQNTDWSGITDTPIHWQ
jgi:hypothetical protein